MNKLLFSLLFSFSAHATLAETARVELPALDLAKLAVEDSATDKNVGPYRYGIAVPLSETQSKSLSVDNGQWQTLDSGEMRWQGEVFAKDATTVDVLLKPFWLPQNAKLTVFDGTGKQIWGPFGHEQNNLANTLPLPLVSGETIRIEVTVPADERKFVQLAVARVTQGYRGLDVVNGQVVQKRAGGCNVDAVCSAADPYRDQARGVVMVTINGGSCTGTLVNSTRADRAPLLLTARHCQITAANAAQLTAYYNYQSATCRPIMAGTFGGLSTAGSQLQLGSTFLAAAGKSDFTLVRLNGAVPAGAQPYWLGWDRRDLFPTIGAAVVHHPQGEEKRISVATVPLSSNSVAFTEITPPLAIGNGIFVESYNVGTTEPGSSGAALLTRDTKRIIGTLSGGSAKCAGLVNEGFDVYGRLFTGWEGENTPTTRLRDYLDPLGTAPQVLDGTNACNAASVSLNVNTANPSSRDDVTYTATASGGVLPYTYAWDLDGDGVTDRTSTSNVITTRYDRARSIDVRLVVTDAAGCITQVTRAMNISAPDLRIDSLSASTQLCGDGDSSFDPGERWRINANVKNFSFPALSAYAQFAPVITAVSPLVVTQGAGVLGSVASGQTLATSADVKIPTDAACGSSLSLNYQAGIDDRAVSTIVTRLNITVAATCNVVNNCALPAQIALRGGSFFNAARGGNGLVSFVIARPAPQVPLFFGAWFTGEPNRNLTWYIVTGDLQGNQVNAQILQTKRNIASPTFSTTNTEVGKAQISLIDPEKFLFSYQFTGGSNSGRNGGEIMQHLFAGLLPAAPNITGHYFVPAESGWGQTYESYISQGLAQQFILTYLYDAAGEPRWTLGNFADNLATGPANTYEVHCPGCAWLDIAPTTKSAGTQSRMFPNGFGNAIISTQFVLPAPLSGNWLKNSVTVTPLSNPPQ